MNGKSKRGVQEDEGKDNPRKRELRYNKMGMMFSSPTLTHHPVPVRSLLDDRLSPDDNVSVQNARGGELPLGS